jgi:O-acetyl-ADP-ribose deacetylase (regulator of RNase III)
MTESSFPVWNISDDYPTFGSDSSQIITNPPTKSTPFTINTTANATLVVAYVAAPITLTTDCIVHPISSSVKGVCAEYKHLSNRAGPELVRELTTKVREHCQSHGNDRLHTADVITTTAGNLSASSVLHVVAPAYTSNYGTAMTNSLSACYVKSLEAAIEECNAKTLAIGGLADRLIRGGFDQNQAYHIALRTIKQFLIKYPNKLQRVMLLTKSKTDCEHVCASIAPLYFPRTQQEVETSKLEFITRSVGDATGAHRTQARRIRVGGAVLDAGEAASPVPNAQRQQASRLAAAATPPASASKFQLSDFPQLNVWKRGKICVRVRDTTTHRDVVSDISTGSQFTIYSIRVAETPSLPGYTIWRRYSEFLTLRDCVVEDATRHRSSELAVLTAVPFPSKVWFGSMDPLVVEERRSMFDSLLRTMSSQCTDRTMAQLR